MRDGRVQQRSVSREKRPVLRAFRHGASRTRTGDLLGAIQLSVFTRDHHASFEGEESSVERLLLHLASPPFTLRVCLKCVSDVV